MSTQIDPTFKQKIDDLKLIATKHGEQLRGDTGKWATFKGEPEKHNEEKLHAEFTRAEIEKAFNEILDSTQPYRPTGLAMILKLQSDFLSALERDYNLRTRGRLRYFAHEAGRRAAQGHDKGPLQNVFMPYLLNLIQLVDRNTDRSAGG